jgi:hypothetical protein
MEETIFKYLGEHWPLLTFILCVITGIVYATWTVAKSVYHWTAKMKSVEDKCVVMDNQITPVTKNIYDLVSKVKSTEDKCIAMDHQLSTITNTLNSLSTTVNGLVVYLKSKDGGMDTSLFASRSPVQLTNLGNKILEDSGGKNFIDKNLSLLIKEIAKQNINTALDVQTLAPLVISNVSTSEIFNSIKDYIFKNPQYKSRNKSNQDIHIALDMNVITNIMGIYLRNKYLEKHPELSPQE